MLTWTKVVPVILMTGLLAHSGVGGEAGSGEPDGRAAWTPLTADAGGGDATGDGVVSVLYAGSLVNLMEHGIGPAFDAATGYRFQGVAGGSVAIAHQILDGLRRADVYISATPQVNALLTGPAHGDWVRWYATFAESPLVIGYNARSAFAAQFTVTPWYDVMAAPGFRLGRTDPALDPKGRLTLEFIDRAARYYGRPDLRQTVLGAVDNPNQVFPEETLIGRLQTGQLDAGFFYRIEAVEARIPYMPLPAAIVPKAEYTVTILRAAPNGPGARTFVRFLLGPPAGALLAEHGLAVLRPRVMGDPLSIPQDLRPLLSP